ncbi:pseudouridine synthase [Solimonas soli]|uniref:pseudouridine synthase n=1 Tax=Solimonas soli TaxID=413479 RepID=UPI001B7FAD2F|nr:pseudouridine synthase [Solimonas soli]
MKTPLPVRDGVGASHVRLPPGAWRTALAFLLERYAETGEAAWRSRLARRLVVDEHGVPLTAETPYRAGATLWYYRELESEPEIPFEARVLYRDDHLLIADKPHFLPVLPSGRFVQQTLLVRLKRELGIDALSPLHRIDRGTAGIVAFSTQAATRGLYQRLFATRSIDKRYEALAPAVDGLALPFTRRSRLVAGEPFFRMREIEGEANSETVFEHATPAGDLALYRLRPVTGKKHQLRVHLAAIGAPIVNDDFYPQLRDATDERAAHEDYSRPLQLLARELSFVDPLRGVQLRFESRRQLSLPTHPPPVP